MATYELHGQGKFELPKGLVVKEFTHKACAGNLTLCKEGEEPGVIASVQTRSTISLEETRKAFAEILIKNGARKLEA